MSIVIFRNFQVLLLLLTISTTQAQIRSGHWRVHLPYHRNASVTAAGNRIYCGSPSGLFTQDIVEGSTERLSRLNGFSDVEVKIVKHNKALQATLVIYENANIDIIDEVSRQIYNIPDVFMKNIIGGKRINNLCFHENKVYLACSFGIVVIDLERKQLVDSWQNLGPGGTQLEFLAVSIFQGQVVASALNGIYSASLNARNLNDFNFWQKIRNSSKSGLSRVFAGKLFALVDSSLETYDGISWQAYTPSSGMEITNLQLSAYGSTTNDLLILSPDKIIIDKGNGTPEVKIHTYRFDAVYDSRGYLAMVDGNYGLTIDNPVLGQLDYYIPNGPVSKTFGRMFYETGKLWVAGGSVNDRWDPLMFNVNKFYQFQNGIWYNFKEADHPLIANMTDFIDVKKNPYGNEVYLSSFGTGIIEVVNNSVVQKYTESNSTLRRLSVVDTNYKPLLTGGLDFDNFGNLWVSNYGVSRPLSVKTRSGTWYSFSAGTLTSGNELGWLTCDDYNNKWVLSLRDKGILVYNDNGTPQNENDDQMKMITKEVGQGGLPSNTVLSVVKDHNGELWIGTNQGLAIISNPGQLFKADKDFDARQIIIKVGSNYEIFLGKEQINCIKVDPANRKWIGTPNGVWLVSEDGYRVIRNFTTANSPLLSNNVMEIGLDESSGEVFFGTEKGIISFGADASEGLSGFDAVEIYPNPVRPDFTGTVTIRGLMDNSVVKITDIAGNLVFETRSNGGFVSWDGRSLAGRRVNTGVYLIFASNNKKDDLKTFAGKILFIN